MSSKQFNDYEENHYYDGLVQIAKNIAPYPEKSAPESASADDASEGSSEGPHQ